jgi:hypothetical protein
VSTFVKILHNLLDSRKVIDSQLAHRPAHRRKVQESYRDFSSRQLVDQPRANFRGHDRHAADFVLHHSLRGLTRSPWIVIGVTENCVVTELPGPYFEALDDFRKKGILDVRDDDPQCPAVARSEMPRMYVRKISQPFDGRQHQLPRALPDFPGLVQDVRHRGCRDSRSLSDIADG